MRHILFLLIIPALILSCGDRTVDTETVPDPKLEEELVSLLQRREYFDLRTAVSKHEGRIDPLKRKIFEAFIQNGFNENSESIAAINDLIKPENKLPDSIVARLLFAQRDNYIKVFDYENAAETGKRMVEKFRSYFDEHEVHSIENKNTIYEGLRDTPA